MKFPYAMLLDFVQTRLNAEQVGDLLTMAGFELEGIEEVGGDSVLDVKVMSNRGDGLSVFGLAREVLAKDGESEPTELYLRAARRFKDEEDESQTLPPNPAAVTIDTNECTRYACRYFDNLTGKDSPDWIKVRLEQSGQRSLGLLVDLTNYVMLELGQPLHVFDYDKLIGGRIVVRKARSGEKLTTLNGVDHELSSDQMMICDAVQPVAVAGVMGGQDSEVSTRSTRILLESAHFQNISVRRTRKQLGLNTDASYRFERSVDPDGVVAAIERFTELLGAQGSEIVDVYPGEGQRAVVEVHIDRAVKLLGMPIRHDEAKSYLERLGMTVIGHGDPYSVIPPSWRPDIVREEDLIEELGRVHGYDRIPERLPSGTTTSGGLKGQYLQDEMLRQAVVRSGYVQIISHSLRDRHPLDFSEENRIMPRNPASPETAYLRDSLLPSLADAATRNGSKNLHLFEMGQVFDKNSAGGYRESQKLALLSTGELLPANRKGEVVPVADYFSLKGDLESIAQEAGFELTFSSSEPHDHRFHPTRQASLLAGTTPVGVIGQIHPRIASELKLPEKTILAELDIRLSFWFGRVEIKVEPISRNPAVGRDIALLIDKAVPYASIERAIESAGGGLLERHWLFDVFEGTGIPEGKHSLGIGLQFRKYGENFTDEEANQARERVVQALASLGGVTR
jgi:phenylalanyl-tRNA synthetase beta chain